jgi:hypothetical protein
MRRRYESDSYQADKARRLRRIQSRAHPELIRAFECGELSLRRFDEISKLGLRRQQHLIAAQKARSTAALLAAEALNRFLDNLSTETPIRLSEVAGAISSALRG